MIKHLNALAISILAILAPIKMVIIMTLVLVVVDLITGVIAAVKRKEPITSAGFRRTTVKILVYELVVILGFLAETYLTGSVIAISKIISSFIGLTELTSIAENLSDITGQPILKILLSKLQSANLPVEK